MARTKREFGRRGPPVVTHRPEGLPEAKPADPKRKRSLAISLVSAGALAAAATHFLERGSASECVPVAVPAAGSTALPRTPTSGAPTTLPTTVPIPPSPAVSSDGCPPGMVRSTSRSGSSRHSYSSWHWSSRSSGSSFFGGSSSSNHATSSSTRRGGFGSIGSFHFSGGS